MTKEELLKELEKANRMDPESGHDYADEALLEFINDKDITDAFEKLEKWYA